MAEHPDGSYLSQSSPVALSFLLGMGLDQRAGTLHHATVTTAFAYLRVSGKGQIQGDGFPRQLAAIKGYAHGLSLLANYTFAKNLSNAPDFRSPLEPRHAEPLRQHAAVRHHHRSIDTPGREFQLSARLSF